MTKSTRSAFTIIEISLAMAFLATLLVTIALLTMNMIALYQKGLSIKSISGAGRALIDDFSRSIAVSPANDALNLCSAEKLHSDSAINRCRRDRAYKFTFRQAYQNIQLPDAASPQKLPIHGVFCTGQYSYLWNTGYALNPKLVASGQDYRATFSYKLSQSGNTAVTKEIKNFRLLKIPDGSRQLCSAHTDSDYNTPPSSNHYNLANTTNTLTLSKAPVEQLAEDTKGLALYDFRVFPPTQHQISRHSFYSGTFILATIAGGVDITGAGDYCQDAPDGLNTDFAYCAINKFNFAMRATGESTDEDR